MSSLTDEEILDFVRENLTLDKDENGSYKLKEILCPVYGDVLGDVEGDVVGDVEGSILGDVAGNVGGNVGGAVEGNVLGAVRGDLCRVFGLNLQMVTADIVRAGAPMMRYKLRRKLQARRQPCI